MTQLSNAWTVLVVIGAVVFGSPTGARAGVVIESYDVLRPEAADPIMAVVLDELGANGHWASPGVVKQALFLAPKPSMSDPTVTSGALTDEMELGIKAYLHADYTNAVVQLSSVRARAYANPRAVVSSDRTKAAMTRALVALALSHDKLGDSAKAIEVMKDYIRSAREPVTRNMFGPPGEQLYNDVRKSLDSMKRGDLVVNVTEPDAQIFIEELGTGRGATYAGALLPGVYRVIVQVGAVSRRYDVVILAGYTVKLDINWALDSALHVSDRWVGLIRSDNAPEAAYVRSLGRRMNERHLHVLGLRQERGYVAVTGAYYDASEGHIIRSGEVHVANATDEVKLRGLARFLAKGEHYEAILPMGGRRSGDEQYDKPHQWPAYVTGVLAFTGFGFGGYLLYIDGKPNCGDRECSTRTSGLISIGSGVLAGTFSVIWYLTHRDVRRETRTIGLEPRSSGGVATIGWSF